MSDFSASRPSLYDALPGTSRRNLCSPGASPSTSIASTWPGGSTAHAGLAGDVICQLAPSALRSSHQLCDGQNRRPSPQRCLLRQHKGWRLKSSPARFEGRTGSRCKVYFSAHFERSASRAQLSPEREGEGTGGGER